MIIRVIFVVNRIKYKRLSSMKNVLKLLVVGGSLLLTTGCHELQQVVNQLPEITQAPGLSNEYIASGLREALDKGIDQQVTKLTAENGFYKNDLVKILLPEELKKVDEGLRKVGLSKIADEGLKVLNRAAEDAVGEATPVFVNAVKGITFDDAKDILMKGDGAATNYLKGKTQTDLYNKFSPVISNSLNKVGANKIWGDLIKKYNSIPFIAKTVNPDLTDYVTNQSLEGVFKMINIEEGKIRTDASERTSDVLRKVFALQDKI